MLATKSQIIFTTVVIGMITAAFFHFYLMPRLGFNYYPINTFLYNPADRYFDFTQNTLLAFQTDKSPYMNIDLFYFPGIAILMLPFIHLTLPMALLIYQVFWSLAFIGASHLYLRNLKLKSTALILGAILFSYPFLFTLDRAQIEGLILALLMWSIWQKEFRHKEIPFYVIVALASSIKIYPLLYLLPDLAKKQYKKVFMTGLLTMMFMLLGLLLMKDEFKSNIQNLISNLKVYQNEYMTGYEGTHHSVSLIATGRFILLLLGQSLQINFDFLLSVWERFWSLISLAGVIYSMWFLSQIKNNNPWKSYFIVACSLCLLAPVSFDYKLIHFFIPLLLFLTSDKNDNNYKLYSFLFGLLLIPKSYIILKEETSISVFLNVIIILFFLVRLIKESRRLKVGFQNGS